MHSNNQPRNYVSALMAQDVSPTFPEVRELVMNYSGRQKGWLLWTRPLIEGALLVALFISLLTHPFAASQMPAKSAAITSSLTTQSASVTIAWNPIRAAKNIEPHSVTELASPPPVSETSDVSFTEVENIKSEQSLPVPSAYNTSAIATTLSTFAAGPVVNRWSAFASGGYNILRSASLTQSLSGSLGIRYALNASSSLLVEARRTSFPVSGSASTSSMRDTIINLGGSSYSNTIGSFSSTASYSTDPITSIGLGYRFELQPLDPWSPFAAIMLGTNTSGLLSSAMLGLSYRFHESYLFDLSARTDQFVAKGTSPERAVEIETGISFAW
jgi:hypothetical protein